MSRPLRYVVELPEIDERGMRLTVGYHTSLGNRDARSWAVYTAARYAGRIILEMMDGTADLFRDYSHRSEYVPGGPDVETSSNLV